MNATIQARAEYRSKFDTFRYRIEIVDSDNAAQNVRDYEITPAGAVVTYEGDEENAFQPIVPSSCEFTLICKTQGEVDFLQTVARSDVGRYGVRVLRASGNTTPIQTHWVGTILSDQLTFADMLPQAVRITATDDLGYLQEKPYLQSNGNRFEGEATVKEHVINCLQLLRTSWHWNFSNEIAGNTFFVMGVSMGKNLLPSNYGSAGSTVDLYDEAKISHAGFHELDSDDKAKSAFYVLEEIAKHFNGQFFFSFNVAAQRLIFQPVGAQIQFADDGTQIQGFTYRSDGALANTFAQSIITRDINNTASQKRRLTGGTFSFAAPYHKVKRQMNFASVSPVITKTFQELEDYYQEFTFELQPQTGDRFRVVCPFSVQWSGISAETIKNIQNLNIVTPDNFNIGRLRFRMRLRFEKAGNDLFLKRPLTGGAQVPFYQTFGNLTASDLPVFYTNLFVNTAATWDADGTEDFYVVVSEPFDPTLDQWLQVPFDFVTPEVPNDCTAVKILIEATYLLPDNTNLVSASLPTNNVPASNNFLTNACTVYGSFRMFPFEGYGLDSGTIVESTNTQDNRRTLDLGDTNVNDKALNSNFAAVKYRQPNGFFQACVTGYTSLIISNSDLFAADIAVQEAAGLYSAPKLMYEGTLVNFGVEFHEVLEIDEGSTTFKMKPLTLEINTGEEETRVTCLQIQKESSYPVSLNSPLGAGLPATPPPSVDAVRSIVNQANTQAVQFNPAAVAYNTNAGAANRGSQVGDRITALNSSGHFVEIADGSNGQVLTTNGSGVYTFAAAGGGSSVEKWHGYSAVIIYPNAFVANDDGSRGSINPEVIEDDTSLTLGVRSTHADTELYAFAPIPDGHKATQIIVYASASTANAVRTFTFNYSTGAITTNTNGAFNSSIDIVDVTGSTTAAIAIKVIPADTSTIIYGARILIATV